MQYDKCYGGLNRDLSIAALLTCGTDNFFLWELSCNYVQKHPWLLPTRGQSHPSPRLWQSRMSLDTARCLLRGEVNCTQLRTVGLNEGCLGYLQEVMSTLKAAS